MNENGYGMRGTGLPLPPVPRDMGPEPYVADIDRLAMQNNNYRVALWTGSKLQTTLMSIPKNGEIGLEMHEDTDQMIKVVNGAGTVFMGRSRTRPDYRRDVKGGDAIFVPAGTWHNVVNNGRRDLKLYSVYAPPHHKRGTIERTKENNS